MVRNYIVLIRLNLLQIRRRIDQPENTSAFLGGKT